MAKSKRARRVFVGGVAIDSGHLLLVDPCYLDYWEKRRSFGYKAVQAATLRAPWFGELAVVGKKAPECTAVAVGSPNGDGVFPVFAEFKDGRLVGLSVRFE